MVTEAVILSLFRLHPRKTVIKYFSGSLFTIKADSDPPVCFSFALAFGNNGSTW